MVILKSIIVPKDKLGLSRLLSTIEPDTNDFYFELKLTDSSFYNLWNLGIFNEINLIADSVIDDFEEEYILDQEKIKYIIEYLSQKILMYPSLSDLDQLLNMFLEAYNRETGIFFYF